MPTKQLAAAPTAAAPERTLAQPTTQNITRVLLVEDEPLTAEVFARALSRDGHVVDVARDGLQALRRLREQRPALLVLDMSLPALSGADVIRDLRRAGLDLPVIVVSGSDRAQTTLSDEELGCGAWLVKPVKPRDLVAQVRRLTRQS